MYSFCYTITLWWDASTATLITAPFLEREVVSLIKIEPYATTQGLSSRFFTLLSMLGISVLIFVRKTTHVTNVSLKSRFHTCMSHTEMLNIFLDYIYLSLKDFYKFTSWLWWLFGVDFEFSVHFKSLVPEQMWQKHHEWWSVCSHLTLNLMTWISSSKQL